MKYCAAEVKKNEPQAITVFIGPCIAKKSEAFDDPNVDYVLTFEELNAWFEAREIDVSSLKGIDIGRDAEGYVRGFATSYGVSSAVLNDLKEAGTEISELNGKFIDGLDKKAIKQLKLYAEGKLPGNFLEVMSCQGGCVGGPCSIGKLNEATATVKKVTAGRK